MIPSFYLAMPLTVSPHSLSDILSAIADAKSLFIFRSIGSEDVNSNILLKRTNLTFKQVLFENFCPSEYRSSREKEQKILVDLTG